MSFNFTAVAPHLPDLERALLISQPPEKWIGILKSVHLPEIKKKEKKRYEKEHPGYKDAYKEALITLAGGIIRAPWTTSPAAKEILKKVTQKKEDKLPVALRDTFKKIQRVVAASQVILPHSLTNVGATCWMNTLLQFMRSSHDFDRLLTQPPAAHIQGDDAKNLVILQTKLNGVVATLRADGFVKEKELQSLHDQFKSCKIPPQDDNRQQDATSVLDLLIDRFGPVPATLLRERRRTGGETVMEPATHYVPLRVTQNGQTVAQMLTAELCNHQAELKNKEGRLEAVRYDYKISAPQTLQVRLNRVGVHLPAIEEQLNIRPFALQDQDESYRLERVMCASAAKKFSGKEGEKEFTSSSGHYYFLERSGTTWIKYDDEKITPLTAADAQKALDEHAYALFYSHT